MPHQLRITALGSSFAAGPSITPIENHAAGRSSRNYAHQLANKLNAHLTDLTVSGATLLNVLSEPQQCGNTAFDPQLAHLPPDTDIATLTCGGNDLDYIGSLIDQTKLSYLGPLPAPDPHKAPPISPQELKSRLLAILDSIHTIAPNARVYLVQYIAVVGTHTRPLYDIALTAAHVEHFDMLAQTLAEAYSEAAGERAGWAEVVEVAKESRAHGLGSPEPWVRGFSMEMLTKGPAPFHPTLEGHTGVAEMLERQIGGSGVRARL